MRLISLGWLLIVAGAIGSILEAAGIFPIAKAMETYRGRKTPWIFPWVLAAGILLVVIGVLIS